jgi:hypothetical protein
MSPGYRRTLLSRAALGRFCREVATVLGGFAIVVGIGAVAYPRWFEANNWHVLAWIAGLAVLGSIVRAWPRRRFSVRFDHPATTITVKVGDLFAEEGHIVLGFSDTFDTEIGDIISADSIQGQFLTRMYRGDRDRLDRELSAALQDHSSLIDKTKARGKKHRFPLGTSITLDGEGRRFICCAYSKLRADNYMAESDIDTIWTSLGNLWQEIRVRGEQRPIAVPIIGSFLARVGGSTCTLLVRLILLSYFVHSRVKPIAAELILVVSEKDLEKVNLIDLENFTRTLNC